VLCVDECYAFKEDMFDTYQQSRYCLISSSTWYCLPFWFCTLTIDAVIRSEPLLMYLNRYLMDVLWLHHLAFRCVLYLSSNYGLYSTTKRLSSSIPCFWTVRLSFVLLYTGNPSWSTIVASLNFLGKNIIHFPSTIHGALLFRSPHGSWIICLETISYNYGSVYLFGISAEII